MSSLTYEDYVQATRKVSLAVEAREYETAIQLLEDLLGSDLTDLDKSIMCINLAVVWDNRGNVPEALRSFDRAIRYEKPLLRFFAQEEKAAYLVRLDRQEEAVSIYRDLLQKPYLALSDKARVSSSLQKFE